MIEYRHLPRVFSFRANPIVLIKEGEERPYCGSIFDLIW